MQVSDSTVHIILGFERQTGKKIEVKESFCPVSFKVFSCKFWLVCKASPQANE